MLLTNEELKPFLQDLRENLSNAIDSVETYREWLTNIMDVNLSVLSYQLNKVMKILAVISAIFIPLTFIAGVYGMNFEFMPELAQPWGYPIVLGLMGVVALSLVILFKTRKWF
jgi:magnesium transporter